MRRAMKNIITRAMSNPVGSGVGTLIAVRIRSNKKVPIVPINQDRKNMATSSHMDIVESRF